MLQRFKNMLEHALGEEPECTTDKELHLAAAVILLEVAKADFETTESELTRLYQTMERRLQLSHQELLDLISQAHVLSDWEASLHNHMKTINAHYSYEEKVIFLRDMWEVACSDGEIHHYEEHLIRRASDLLYLPHADFIRTKHQALKM